MFSDLQINYFPAREGVGGERQVGEKGTSVIGMSPQTTFSLLMRETLSSPGRSLYTPMGKSHTHPYPKAITLVMTAPGLLSNNYGITH